MMNWSSLDHMSEIDELEEEIHDSAMSMLRRNHNNPNLTGCPRRFRSLFGVDQHIVTLLWIEDDHRQTQTAPSHLLWTLMFLKVYATETVHSAIAGTDEKTFRKWVWMWIDHIAHFNAIVWGHRLMNAYQGATLFVSLDGVDFRINEPQPFDRMWFSHKFQGAGLRYEVALCIRTGYIVWVNGGVPCGSWPDITLARSAFVYALSRNEKALADRGYSGDDTFITPNSQRGTTQRQKQIMSRHETVNARLKQFGVLAQVFRHRLDLHPLCFHSVANIVQITLENGSPLFSV